MNRQGTSVASGNEAMALKCHQKQEVDFLRQTPRALLLSETGTGKTATLLAYAGEIMDAGGQVAWITSKGLLGQVEWEAGRWLPTPMQPVALDKANASSRFIIATHGVVQRRIRSLDWLVPDLLIVDEAAVVGTGGEDPGAAIYAAIKEVAARSARSVMATATPVGTVHAMDLYALLGAGCMPGKPTRAELELHLRYATVRYGWSQREFLSGISDRGLELLTRPLRFCAIRTTVEQTGQAMPAVSRRVIAVPLPADHASAYARAAGLQGLRRHHGQQRASRAPYTLAAAAVDYLMGPESAKHSKVVLFSEYFDVLGPLLDLLDKTGLPVYQLNGAMTPKQRQAAIDGHRLPGDRVLVGTSALEEGLNLQHASLLISIVESWSKARQVQREGRLRRIGSPHEAIEHVIIRPRVLLEQRKDAVLERKESIARAVLAAIPSTK